MNSDRPATEGPSYDRLSELFTALAEQTKAVTEAVHNATQESLLSDPLTQTIFKARLWWHIGGMGEVVFSQATNHNSMWSKLWPTMLHYVYTDAMIQAKTLYLDLIGDGPLFDTARNSILAWQQSAEEVEKTLQEGPWSIGDQSSEGAFQAKMIHLDAHLRVSLDNYTFVFDRAIREHQAQHGDTQKSTALSVPDTTNTTPSQQDKEQSSGIGGGFASNPPTSFINAQKVYDIVMGKEEGTLAQIPALVNSVLKDMEKDMFLVDEEMRKNLHDDLEGSFNKAKAAWDEQKSKSSLVGLLWSLVG